MIQTLMIKLLPKFVRDQITLLLILGIGFDYLYQSKDFPQALVHLTLNYANDQSFYVDSGATLHMTNDAGKISYIKPYDGRYLCYYLGRKIKLETCACSS